MSNVQCPLAFAFVCVCVWVIRIIIVVFVVVGAIIIITYSLLSPSFSVTERIIIIIWSSFVVFIRRARAFVFVQYFISYFSTWLNISTWKISIRPDQTAERFHLRRTHTHLMCSRYLCAIELYVERTKAIRWNEILSQTKKNVNIKSQKRKIVVGREHTAAAAAAIAMALVRRLTVVGGRSFDSILCSLFHCHSSDCTKTI